MSNGQHTKNGKTINIEWVMSSMSLLNCINSTLASIHFLASLGSFFNFSLSNQCLVDLLYWTEDTIKPSHWTRTWEREMLNDAATQRNTNNVTRAGTVTTHTTITDIRGTFCVFNSAPRRWNVQQHGVRAPRIATIATTRGGVGIAHCTHYPLHRMLCGSQNRSGCWGI
jgi:hypothetical protein